MKFSVKMTIAIVVPLLLVVSVTLSRPLATVVDPGPRGGSPGAGGPLPGLSSNELQQFNAGLEAIQEVESVSGTVSDTGLGLGPRFNMDSCSGCHNYPAPGGNSPPVNPQVAVATKNGAINKIPYFIKSDGPILRPFVQNNATAETHLFTIAGRSDASGCNISAPDFDAISSSLSFHTPLPLYGNGLIEEISTSTINANLAADLPQKQALGIEGHTAGAGGSGRFFWKGQLTGLTTIAGGAYQDEIGVTNLVSPVENDTTPSCQFNSNPEDRPNPRLGPIEGMPDFQKIAAFSRFAAGPTPIADTPSIANGRTLFSQIGCAYCHTPSLQTSFSSSPALSRKNVPLYSDLALHHMGALADGIVQGNAAGDEFRTPPLWGLGQRIFFLHDGRTKDLVVVISQHASAGATRPSEANAVVGNYNALTDAQKQDLLNFLRSL